MRHLRSHLLALLVAFGVMIGPAFAKVEIVVDLSKQRMTVVKNSGETFVWKISSGRAGFETPTGSYIVQRLDADHHSDEYDQAPMPWSIFFSRGLAIHGTFEGGLGRPRSHGCVRLAEPNARQLYSWVEQYGASIEIVGAAHGGAEGGGTEPRARPQRRYEAAPTAPPPAEPPSEFFPLF